MEIKVRSVQRSAQTLRIDLEMPWMANGELTDIGNRAMRILRRHASTAGRDIQLDTLVLYGVSHVEQINTRDSLQEECNRYADVPIELRFSERVFAYGREKRELYTGKEVELARQEGLSIYLYLHARSNLPFTERDCRRIEALVPGSTMINKDNPYLLEIGVPMYGNREKHDPWAYADESRLTVRKIVT